MTSEAPATAGVARSARLRSQEIGARFGFEPHNCFACGSLNAHGLQLDLHVAGGRCWVELSIPSRFAHGGIVTTILDEVMAWSLVDTDNWGPTARLAVDVKRPVPLERPIHAEGWVTETRRRLFRTAGHVLDQATDEVLATAHATYIGAPEDRKRELKRRYGYRVLEDRRP